MSENAPETPADAEVRKIRHLVRLMHRYDLTAVDLGEGPSRIRLRRRGTDAPNPTPAHALPVAPPAAPPATIAAPAPPPATTAPAGVLIESPMVGTFYASSSPDSPPFVAVGSRIQPESTVCIIEAMKVFTDIPAGVGGTVADILVKSGQAVEFGQALFRVTPD